MTDKPDKPTDGGAEPLAPEAAPVKWAERLLAEAKRYSLWQVCKAALIVLLIGWAVTLTVWLWSSGRRYADRYADITMAQLDVRSAAKDAAHDRAMAYRRDIATEIKALLKATLTNTHASRVFVIELHNGTNNPVGLPFLYGEMTYEVTDERTDFIAEEYNQITLSRYDFAAHVRDRKYWVGNVAEFEEIDRRMSQRLKAHGVDYFAVIHISGRNGDVGYLGIDWCDGCPSDREAVRLALNDAAQRLASLLDYK